MITAGFSHDEASSFDDRCSGRGARGEDRGGNAGSGFVVSGDFLRNAFQGTGFHQRNAATAEASQSVGNTSTAPIRS